MKSDDDTSHARIAGMEAERGRFFRGALIAGALVAVGVLACCSYNLAAGAIARLVAAGNVSVATMSAEIMRRDLERCVSLGKSVAELPCMAHDVEARDAESVRRHLRPMATGCALMQRLYVTDSKGVVWAEGAGAPTIVGQECEETEWYRRLAKDCQPCVAEWRRQEGGRELLTMVVAVPLRSARQEVAGALVMEYRLEGLCPWLKQAPVGEGGAVLLLDGKGRLLAGASRDEYAKTEVAAAVFEGRATAVEYRDPVKGQMMVAASAPVAVGGGRWVVLAQQPQDAAYRPVRVMGMQISGGMGVLIVVGGVVLMLAERNKDRFNRLNRKLRDRSLRMRELATIVESSGDAIIGQTTDGYVVSWNEGAERLFGYSALETRGRPVTFLWPVDRAGEIRELLGRIGRGAGVLRLETVCVRRDGSAADVWLTVSPVRNTAGELTGSSIIARDISERRRAEASLARQTKELENYNAEMEQVAYVTAHDLQEPLRMVGSYTQLLARRYKGRLDAEADQFIGYAVEGVKRMQNQLNDILAFTRIGRSRKAFDLVDCEAVVHAALAGLKMTIRGCGAEVSRGPLPVVVGDARQLVRLFEHLLDNALKFRRPEAPPRISIHAGLNGKEWLFSVHDNGVGIEPQYWERVFGLFFRLHPREKYPGTGLGLAMCRKIVERHGGHICVESELGKGTTFYFTLPARRENGA